MSLFVELSNKIREGSRAFLNYLEDYDNSESSLNFKDIEHQADLITHEINEKLYKTYLSPFEPADIHALAEKMDSILDLIVSSQIKLGIFNLKRPLEDISRMAVILDQTVLKLEAIVNSFADPKYFEAVLKQCADVREMESQSDNLFYDLIKSLFARQDYPVELFNRKQILEQIKEAMSRCKDVSNIIEGIILKNG